MRAFLAVGFLPALFGVFGCGATDASTSSGTAGTGGQSTGSGGTGGSGAASTSSGTTGSSTGFGGFGGFGGAPMTPVRKIPGLAAISFYERTGGTEPTEYDFAIEGAELTVRLDDPLGTNGFDIAGASSEYYDVYYSNEDGSFNLDGSYLTISGVFELALPAGGGLNLAEIGLHYTDAATEFGNYVASYKVLGDNSVEANVGNCIDGDLQTHTTMGNTVGSAERLRLTLGFASSSGEPK
ncbi:MAG: hypothetical protein IPK82_37370 [Polyangiaceae bacterium]|nr:hypothetical protein [Polyangiaceae bacterium]